jgi:putative transposase
VSINKDIAMLNLATPPGFQGLHPDKKITIYMRNLPHWRQEGATYFVTFRQADSLPQEKLQELKTLRQEWEEHHPLPRTDAQWQQLTYEIMHRLEHWLDQGMGSCRLQGAAAAKFVVDAMRKFGGKRYELGSYVVMPNHVHGIVRPLVSDPYPLEQLLKIWKGHSALQIYKHFGLTGSFWQEETFDRIIREEEHLYKAIQYIGNNPAKAGLSQRDFYRWIRPEWEDLGWRFADA